MFKKGDYVVYKPPSKDKNVYKVRYDSGSSKLVTIQHIGGLWGANADKERIKKVTKEDDPELFV